MNWSNKYGVGISPRKQIAIVRPVPPRLSPEEALSLSVNLAIHAFAVMDGAEADHVRALLSGLAEASDSAALAAAVREELG